MGCFRSLLGLHRGLFYTDGSPRSGGSNLCLRAGKVSLCCCDIDMLLRINPNGGMRTLAAFLVVIYVHSEQVLAQDSDFNQTDACAVCAPCIECEKCSACSPDGVCTTTCQACEFCYDDPTNAGCDECTDWLVPFPVASSVYI